MVTDALLGLIESAVMALVSLFPTSETDVFSYVDQIAGNLGALNYFLPISETFAVVVGVLVIFPLFMGVTLSLWILAQLRGSSSRG